MGFYARRVLPRLIDLAMRNEAITAERRRLVTLARGTVLEVGFGSGLNLPLYGRDVRRLYALDPSEALWRLARRRAPDSAVPLTFIRASAEAIPLAADAVDDIVMTWSLCSIPHPSRALAEMRRVLKPTGRLIFVEHGRAPDARVRLWQDGLTPAWKRVGGGCHLNRPIDRLIAEAGFHLREIERAYGKGPKPFTYLYKGVAEGEPGGGSDAHAAGDRGPADVNST